MNTLTLNLAGSSWTTTSTEAGFHLALKGQAYLDHAPVDVRTLATQLAAAKTPEQLTVLLKRLNGFYAWVEESPGQVRVAVDHIRSRPLFYGLYKDQFYLGDDAEWVRQQVRDEQMDPLAREEFLLAGYVTGRDTLYPSVKQLQAGECLVAQELNSTLQVRFERYYRFEHTEPNTYTEAELHRQLERVTLNAMRRLIEYAVGRQIVIPLSGGYDSRLVASMLKKLGYHNVLCFSYGVTGNKEAEYSRQVAKALNFEWKFVEYSTALWRKEWASTEAQAYRRMAANHVSLPHIQDWLAIKQLLASGGIAPDALVVPGHSGDFVAGSHIPGFVFSKAHHTEQDLLQALINAHLSNAPKQDMAIAEENQLALRLQNRIALPFVGTDVALASLYEMWDWQERQAKYIVNSVRVYEQFKLDWWLPLWDLEFVRFWEGVPLALRKERVWFKEWISSQYAAVAKIQPAAKNMKTPDDFSRIYKIAQKVGRMLPGFISEPVKRMRYKHACNNHFLAFEGLIDSRELNQYLKMKFDIIGIYSDLYIKNKW